eukprot:6078400-Lingulodinium_polyedra.AAC.1
MPRANHYGINNYGLTNHTPPRNPPINFGQSSYQLWAILLSTLAILLTTLGKPPINVRLSEPVASVLCHQLLVEN